LKAGKSVTRFEYEQLSPFCNQRVPMSLFLPNELADRPHRRFNALTAQWVLVSPHRAKRPWQGQRETEAAEEKPNYDESCYLCPGNERAGGEKNPDYTETYVFTNDFRALLDDGNCSPLPRADDPLMQYRAVQGTCRVICFSSRHDLTLPQMDREAIRTVIDTWAEQLAELGAKYRWVQVFENKGAIMGCSNPHPHGQIWASDQLPNEVEAEDRSQKDYLAKHGSPLLVDYVNREIEQKERVVVENDDWVVVVPFWATWPFETLLMPRWPVQRLLDLTDTQRDSLASILKRCLIRYDNLFEISFPYSMGWHGAPFDNGDQGHWQLHAHFYPPLLRSATVKKFMVGYEMLGEPQRDLTPEQAAAKLRELSETRYALL